MGKLKTFTIRIADWLVKMAAEDAYLHVPLTAATILEVWRGPGRAHPVYLTVSSPSGEHLRAYKLTAIESEAVAPAEGQKGG